MERVVFNQLLMEMINASALQVFAAPSRGSAMMILKDSPNAIAIDRHIAAKH